MNLKEYNYCKRHHSYALAKYLGIKINVFRKTCINEINIHDATCFKDDTLYAASYDWEDTSRYISLCHLM